MLKHGYPFRLGCTSYVYPGDMVFNAERLAPVFDDIELVLFQSSDASNFPDDRTMDRLGILAQSYGTTYTVHFPIDKKAGAEDSAERDGFLGQVKGILELTRNLQPYGYILHLEGAHRHTSEKERIQWHDTIRSVCDKIIALPGIEPSKICVENLDYPVDWYKHIAESYGFSFCLDLGHCFLYNDDWRSIAVDLLPHSRVIHLHGVFEGKDHVSLKKHDRSKLAECVSLVLSRFNGVVTLETFCEQDTFGSVEIMKQLWQK
jgi:sugar phosphate isomerase/epimerase